MLLPAKPRLAIDRLRHQAAHDRSVAAGLILLAAAAALATVWALQFDGFAPCHLCYLQRWPYYASLPLAAGTLWLALSGRSEAARIGLALLALTFLVSAGLGVYHAGVEWHWWTGPTDCTGSGQTITNAKVLLKQLDKVAVVRCDEAALRVLGLSLAGWNVVLSLVLVAVATAGLRRR